MKNYFITLDTGTTNTRAILWDSGRNRVAAESRQTGVRDTAITGSKDQLKAAVKDCLDSLIAQSGIAWDGVSRVIASGMITSDVGLVAIPHLTAPAGLDELAAAAAPLLMEDVCPVPIWFIPGVKNSVSSVTPETLEQMDIMRGEEVESVYLIDQYRGRELLLVLPGSHTKFISADAEGKITGCLTTITGEMLNAIIEHTIIAGAVGNSYVEADTYDRAITLEGYRAAKRTGLARACFSGRIRYLFVDSGHDSVGNFILGAVLGQDVIAIQNSKALRIGPSATVVVAGKNPLRQAIADILTEEKLFSSVEQHIPADDIPLSALGAFMIAKKNALL